MAKKRKTSNAKKPTTRIPVPNKKINAVMQKKSFNTVQAAKILALSGGIITLLAGILAMLFASVLTLFMSGLGALIAVPNIIAGIVMLITVWTIKTKTQCSAIILLVASLIALVTPPMGFVVGPVLSFIGALVLLIRRA